MAGYSVAEVLAPLAIVDRISRIDLPGTSLSKLFGWNVYEMNTEKRDQMVSKGAAPSGNVRDWPMRTGQYDIFDVSRRIATGRVPGTAPSMQKPQKVGDVQFTIPRSAEMMTLKYEDLNNRRQLGAPVDQIDRNGLSYINSQLEYVGQKYANLIEFQTAAMCRGSYTFTANGDDLEHTFSGGGTTISYQIPAANLDQLNMLAGGNIISASWADPATDIPLQLININKAFIQLTGQGLEHIVCRGQTWNNVINNDAVVSQSGSSNTPFESLTQVSPGEYTARLRALPWITWHIVDYGLEVWDGSAYTFTTLLEDDHAIFLPTPNPRWVEYIRGYETVVEGPGGRKSDQYGFYAYSYPIDHPAGVNVGAVFNGFPSLTRPKAIAYGDTTP